MALRGTLETYTLQKGALGPVGLALVRLDAGPLVTAAIDLDAGPLRLGARVEGLIDQVPAPDLDRTIRRLRFHLASTAPSPSAANPARSEVPR